MVKSHGLPKVSRYAGHQHRHDISRKRPPIEIEAAVWKLWTREFGRVVAITLPVISIQAKMFKGQNRLVCL